MDSTHIHLLLNHFPIIGTLIGGGVMLWGMMLNQKNIKAVAAAIIIVMAILAVPVYLTGEPAQERVEHLPGVSEAMIEEHEEAAESAIWVLAVAGTASLAALLLQYRSTSRVPFGIATLFTLLAFAAMARVGYYGGQIRHSELRSDQQPTPQGESHEEEHDDH